MSNPLDIPPFLKREKGAPAAYRGPTRSLLKPAPVVPPKNGKRLTKAARAEKKAIDAEISRITALAKHGRVEK